MIIKELVPLLARYILALGLAATTAVGSQAQDFQAQPSPFSDGGDSGFPPLSNQQPGPDTPPYGSDVPPLGPMLPPASPVLPEQPPATSPSSPGPGGKNNGQGQAGEMMDFAGFGGNGGMQGFGGGMFPSDSLRYRATWLPGVPVQGQATNFQMVGQDLSFTHPLWTDPLNALSVSGGVRNDIIQTGAILPNTGQPIPSDLWNVNLGLRYFRQLDNGWMAGGGVSLDSASDHPFAAVQEMNVGLNAMLRIPQGEHNAWIFSLMYSPTSELNFPLPGVVFSWNPSPQFHANIGLPFQVTWRPSEDWQFQASYMLIHTIHVKAQYRLAEHLRAFAAYDWTNEAYTLLERPEDDDRLFLYDQRVSMGLQASLFHHWTASLAGGYVFDRYLFEGTSFAASGADRVNLGNGPFAALNLGLRY